MSKKYNYKLSFIRNGKLKERTGVVLGESSSHVVKEVIGCLKEEDNEVSIVVKKI